MIYVTGDIHGDPSRLGSKNFPEGRKLTKDDFVVILGDFGLVWNWIGEDREEKHWLDWLEDKPFTTLFVDGNHDNHDRLNDMPEIKWHGGMIHKVRDSVIHLMRGYVFDIDGCRCFTFGGAQSHDISDGILTPRDMRRWRSEAEEWARRGLYLFRIRSISWWEAELPTDGEMERGIGSLEKAGWDVDFVFTHSPSSSESVLMGYKQQHPDRLMVYLEDVLGRLNYKRHYFGHLHRSMAINHKNICLYEDIERIN